MAKAGALGRLAALAYRRTSGAARPVRLIHTYHGHVFEGYFEGWKTRVFLAVERWLGRRTDAVIAISSQVRHDILHTYGIARDDQIALIPLGFNLDRLAAITPADRRQARVDLGIPDDALVVSTVGRLTAIKQHGLFLEMAARLVRSSRRYLFLIVGDGELRGDIEARVNALGLGTHVRFLGWRRDLERIYGATDVFVLTSRNEGTPVALIEAMAAGVAPVSTDVGGVRDVITDEHVGIVVPFGDAAALAEAVTRLSDAPALRRALGGAGRKAVLEKFRLRRLLDDITGLYRRLLSAG
jgi:glycosyltransferase involved in cell wall biosynthesis